MNEVLTFWFDELSPKQWFAKDNNLDKAITVRFSKLLKAAEPM